MLGQNISELEGATNEGRRIGTSMALKEIARNIAALQAMVDRLKKTEKDTPELRQRIKKIENEMGRAEGIRFGPRPIDIDILLYDRLIELAPALTIPHPRMHERAFVLVPLNEIAPTLVHPRLRATIRELLARLESTQEVRLFKSVE